MGQIVPVPINPPPGVVVTETQRTAFGRWTLPFDKIRFVHGRPQKIGGSVQLSSTAMVGTPRATLCWQDFLQNGYVACGTYLHLYAFDSGYNLTDITPIRSTGTFAANPFTTTNGSNVVIVTLISHGANAGDQVTIAGATTFANVTLNGVYVVGSVISPNAFTITATTTANSSATGGGGAVTYSFQINVGTELGAYGQGWGTGTWGEGTWGTPRGSSTIFYEPRVWTFDNFGEILVATYNGGSLWFFDPTQPEPWPPATATYPAVPGTPADNVPVIGAPTTCRALFVSPERFVFIACANMIVNVSSQGDPTTWIPATTNTAFARTLQIGTKLIAGRALAPYISMIWSDNACYLFQYTGSQYLYNSSLAGRDCGLISPNAAVTVDGFAYWMGPDNFYFYNGIVQPIANVEDIRKYVFDNLPSTLQFQTAGVYVAKYHEIWWFYSTTGSVNPTNFVIFHLNDQCWSVGTCNFYSSVLQTMAGRASGSHFTAGDTSPVLAGTDGILYNHDPIDLNYDDNGQPLTWYLTLSPYAMQSALLNVDVEGIEFDFFQQSGAIACTVNTYDRLTDTSVEDTSTISYPETQGGLTDFRLHGRYIELEMSQGVLGGYMRFGLPIAQVRPAGTRR